MNIHGLRSQHGDASYDTKSNTASSSQSNEPSQTGKSPRLQRQNQISTTNRYSAHPLPGTQEHARAARFLRGKEPEDARPSTSSGGQPHERAQHGSQGPAAFAQSPLRRQNANRESPALANFYNDMMASPKASRSAPLPNEPEKIPKRLQEKMDSIDLPRLKKLDQDLYQYATVTMKKIKGGLGSDGEINAMDKKLLPLVADAENARNPGLNLRVFKNPEECYSTIKEQHNTARQSNETINMRVVYPPFKGAPDHHVALDVQLKPGHRPSVIGYESAPGNLMSILFTELSHRLPGAKINLVGNTIQSSNWDCAMYSLNNALKSFKQFDDYTSHLHKGERGTAIPAVFMKHAQSKSLIEGDARKDDVVTKDKSGPHMETLAHRNMAYRADRGEISYSTSIEGFRLQEIQRAGEFLATQKHRN